MKKVMKKTFSVLLGIILIANMIIFAPISNIEAKEHGKENNGKHSKEDKNIVLKDDELAESLHEYGVYEHKHTERLEEKEKDLNTIVYLNSDGSETAYIFKEPIKYIDDEGNVQDKSNKLSEDVNEEEFADEYAYVNDRNDINTYFPETLEKDTGVTLNYEGLSIEMYPTDTCSEVSKTDDNMIVYDDAFGNSAQLQYEATFDGFKENIVIYDGEINTFSFIAEADGMYIEEENGALNFVELTSGDVAATISPIYVYDSLEGDTPEGETHYSYANQLKFKELEAGKYEITIIVDEEFLSNPATIYPVYVDPSVSIKAAGSGSSKTIIDNPIYNGTSVRTVTSGANTTAVVGYVNGSYGTGRLLMSFPGLMKQSFMNSKYTITSATLNLKEVSGQSKSSTIAAYNYTGPTWNESSVYSSSIWSGVGSYLGSASFSYPNYTTRSINILSAVKSWQTNSSAASKGIILKNTTSESSTSYYKCICTSENGTKPYVTVNYFYNGVQGVRIIGATSYPNINCQGYAFFSTKIGVNIFPQMTVSDIKYCRGTTVSNALTRTKLRMETWLNDTFGSGNWRVVSGYNSSLASDEWLVCMRIGVVNGEYDYHYWYRASNGTWYNKHGYYSAYERLTGVMNPSTANTSSGWALGNITNFYSSNTVYYAVKK